MQKKENNVFKARGKARLNRAGRLAAMVGA